MRLTIIESLLKEQLDTRHLTLITSVKSIHKSLPMDLVKTVTAGLISLAQLHTVSIKS